MIYQILKKINQSWLEGHPENLSQFFHDNMMIVSPDFKILGAGKAVCVKSYSDFISQAVIKDYQESDPEIHVWANTATAFYNFEMAWEMDGKSFQESGRDFFVFTYENGRWQAVWQKQFSVNQTTKGTTDEICHLSNNKAIIASLCLFCTGRSQ